MTCKQGSLEDKVADLESRIESALKQIALYEHIAGYLTASEHSYESRKLLSTIKDHLTHTSQKRINA